MTENPENKTCPFCAETIKAKAIACRYCGKDLPGDGRSVEICQECGAPLKYDKSKAVHPLAGILGVLLIIIGVIFSVSSCIDCLDYIAITRSGMAGNPGKEKFTAILFIVITIVCFVLASIVMSVGKKEIEVLKCSRCKIAKKC